MLAMSRAVVVDNVKKLLKLGRENSFQTHMEVLKKTASLTNKSYIFCGPVYTTAQAMQDDVGSLQEICI